MIRMHPECRQAQQDLAQRRNLDAVGHNRLELHLRRCSDCRTVAQQLEMIEAGPELVSPIGEDHKCELYNRLAPALYEIADRTSRSRAPRWDRWMVVFGTGLAAAMVAVVLAFWSAKTPAAPPASSQSPETAAKIEVFLEGLVHRSEGNVRIDEKEAGGRERVRMAKNTQISLDPGARFSFNVDHLFRIALFGEADWRLATATQSYVEMQLDRGRLAVDFNHESGRILKVYTPDTIVVVKGTIFTVEVLASGETRVSVLKGSVEAVPRHGEARTVQVGAGEIATIPGSHEPSLLTNAQRALAAELKAMEEYPDGETRLVRFDGSPERINVEVEGRVLGTTPLTMRLPKGPISYTLAAPGMEPLTGTLEAEKKQEVSFYMTPAIDYKPAVQRPARAPRAKKSAERRSQSSKSYSQISLDFFNRARAAVTAGDIPFAIGLLEKVVEESSGERFVSGLALLAECYAAVGEYGKAADVYDRIVAMNPDSSIAQNARYEVGRLAMDRLGDLPRARAAFTAYVASSRGGALREEAYYSLCELDSRAGAHYNAAHCFNEFLRSFPDGHRAPDARLQRGAFYQELENRWPDAERDLLAFIQAKPLHPRTEEARYRVVLGRYQMHDEHGALRMIDEYLRKHPDGQYKLRVSRIRQSILSPDITWKKKSKQ